MKVMKVSEVQASKSHFMSPKGFKGKICAPTEDLDKAFYTV